LKKIELKNNTFFENFIQHQFWFCFVCHGKFLIISKSNPVDCKLNFRISHKIGIAGLISIKYIVIVIVMTEDSDKKLCLPGMGERYSLLPE
jgi:hypothetical protein